jgi:hypothetical protein
MGANPVLVLNTRSSAGVGVTVSPPTSSDTPPFSYQLQRATVTAGSIGSYSNVGSAVASQTTAYGWLDATVTANTTYAYKVVCTDSAGSPAVTTSNVIQALAGSFQFTGVRGYITTANGTHSLDGPHLAKAYREQAVSRVTRSLSAACDVKGTGGGDAAAQASAIAEADNWRQVLSLTLDGVERAIKAVAQALGQTVPTFSKNTNES